MSVVVHLKDGRNQELRQARSCSWSSAPAGNKGTLSGPKWLVCRNERGEVVGTFPEAEIAGYKLTPRQQQARVRLSKVWQRPAV